MRETIIHSKEPVKLTPVPILIGSRNGSNNELKGFRGVCEARISIELVEWIIIVISTHHLVHDAGAPRIMRCKNRLFVDL
jgi:hypothetical protein